MAFHINTKNTSYIIDVLDSGQLSCLHYGRRLSERADYSALKPKHHIRSGLMVTYGRDDDEFGLDDALTEHSSHGRGDFSEAMVGVTAENGGSTSDFRFVSHSLLQDKPALNGLPCAYCESGGLETHVFELCDKHLGLTLRLYYTAFYESDVIVRRAELINESASPIQITRLMSAQLDLPDSNYTFITFNGSWVLERQKTERRLAAGIFISDSKQGMSSAEANPFVMLRRNDATEHSGEVYGFNLVYSGNHAEIVDCRPSGKLRFLTGINPAGFSWRLNPDERFESPEAIFTYSADGLNGVSRNMHRFVQNHIVRGEWKNKERPVLVNNWEGTWFDFDEHKLISIAKEAAKLGVELFVLDDGWFGERSRDDRALGDWDVNTKKLPHGIGGLQRRIAELGMDFGLWVEPEMINENSSLYRAHPDWAVKLPGREPALSRNQLILDLTLEDVRDYLIRKMSEVFSLANISYIKWDCNRNFSDAYTESLPPERQGEFFHRYILGLYEVLTALTERFPHILFESCASGGNRFDLGMLSYMPQVWTSDDTDPMERLKIQGGTSYGYPQSVMGAHVSASPHHSTLRVTPIETRFNVAAFGLLGYEMDLTKLTTFDKNCIRAQIDYYKAHRRLLQFGRFIRLNDPFRENRPAWMVVSENGAEAVAGFYQFRAVPGHTRDVMHLQGLDENGYYFLDGRKQYLSIKAFGGLVKHVMPVTMGAEGVSMTLLANRYMFPMNDEHYEAGGDMLMYAGLSLNQQFGGTGYNEHIRLLSDNGSRMYYIKRVD